MRKLQILIAFIVIGLLTFITGVNAQGVITNGSGSVGSLSAQSPLAIYSYQSAGAEQITVQVLGLTPGLNPTISAIAGTGQQLGLSNTDPLSPGTNSARLTVDVANVSLITFIVSSQTGAVGDFALRLDAVPVTPPQDVNDGASSTDATTGNSVLTYIVPAPDVSQLVTVSTIAPDVNFTVNVYLEGSSVGFAAGNSLQPATMVLPPSDIDYTLRVFVSTLNDATIDLNIVAIGQSSPPPATAIPPTQAPIQATPTATVITATEEATVEEVATDVVATATVVPPTQPVATQGAPTATVAEPTQAQPTATFTPSYTPTMAATATYTPSYTPTTPPAAQIAPEDPRFNNPLDIPLDSTVSVLDFVSYPGGDREDRVRFSVTGMNNNSSMSGGRARLVIAVSCFGQGTDQIQFFTGGQTYTCGQTLVDREVTADSDTGSIVITAIGGEGTYVQWVLTGTATRVN